MTGAELSALAAEAGLHERWEDVHGRTQRVRPDTLRAVLAAMDLPAADEAQARESREALRRRQTRAARDFLILEAGARLDLADLGAARGRLRYEDGRTVELASGAGTIVDVPGRHQLEIGERTMRLAVTPPRAFGMADAAPGERLWGATAQIYALREASASGFGDFAALASAAAALGKAGASALAVSPVHALFAADPSRFSPYGPSSRLFLNVLYADPARFGVEESGPASPDDLIDWPAASERRMAALRQAHSRLAEAGDAVLADFAQFRQDGGADLERHALFEALHGHFFAKDGARGWADWPQAYHDPSGSAARAFAQAHAGEIEFHLFLQWLAERSLSSAQSEARSAGMGIGLITDVAVGMDPGGSHAWSRPQDLLTGVNVGAPPDAFQARGQDWGVTAFSPAALAQTNYAGFLATLRSAMRHAGGVRIDHILGLRRLWLVPHGASPTEGVYLNYPLSDLLRLIALESWRERAVVIGEDLGTVPPGFRDELRSRRIMGMGVLLFEREADGGFRPPDDWPQETCAMTTTHDLPPIAGWWGERDIDVRRSLDAAPPEASDDARQERAADRRRLWTAARGAGCAAGDAPDKDTPAAAVSAAVAYVAATPCDLALIPLEDLLALQDQVNVPGTVDEQPNWRRRLAGPLQDLLAAPAVRARLEDLRTRRPG
ncbi:MAG: 4-alpha-glucanotransferase [Phenylobacterium sp. RIFCSPHIGHO2_01_FULL_70_10]|nr:MAG: 4-alpha-glucanotransferase [Phenylobacterium sp. RIFCSPHIGHO2_01_FULL_70_10]